MKHLMCCMIALAALMASGQTSVQKADTTASKPSRLTLGGYGEAVASRMFYSNNYKRYTDASLLESIVCII